MSEVRVLVAVNPSKLKLTYQGRSSRWDGCISIFMGLPQFKAVRTRRRNENTWPGSVNKDPLSVVKLFELVYDSDTGKLTVEKEIPNE